jgi:hypothetical protein
MLYQLNYDRMPGERHECEASRVGISSRGAALLGHYTATRAEWVKRE